MDCFLNLFVFLTFYFLIYTGPYVTSSAHEVTVSDLLLSDIHGTRKEKELADLRVSDLLLSDMFRTLEKLYHG